jgi:acyl-CoA thioester hydrolase
MTPEFDPALLRKRATFPFFVAEKVRLRDTDYQGHVNNAVYATYFEIGRGAARDHAFSGRKVKPDDAGGVVARQILNYHAAITPPAVIEIGAGILRIGRTSYEFGTAVFWNGQCAASGQVTVVMVEKASGKPMAIPEDYRRGLENILLRQP